MTGEHQRERRSDCAHTRCARVNLAMLAARRVLQAGRPLRTDVLDRVVDLVLAELTRKEDAPAPKPRVDQPQPRPVPVRRPGRHAARGDRAGRLIGP